MKKVILIILCIIFNIVYLTGCSSIIDYSSSKIDIRSVDTYVQEWVGKNRENNGEYICKDKTQNNQYVFYLYVNNYNKKSNKYFSYSTVTIGTDGKKGLAVDTVLKENDVGEELLFKIVTKNKEPEYVIINGTDIKNTDIEEIPR